MDASLYAYPDVDRPWVRVNFVASVDGSAQDADGVSGAFGGEPDHEVFTILRGLADVVLVSAGTARTEDYGPVDAGVLALVTRSLDVPERLRVPGVLVLAPGAADPEAVATLQGAGVEVLLTGDDEIDWTAALDELGRRGLRRVLCEGGPSLLGELLAHDLVDDLCLTVAPVLVAGEGSRIAASSEPVHHDLRLAHAVEVDGVLLTRWLRDR